MPRFGRHAEARRAFGRTFGAPYLVPTLLALVALAGGLWLRERAPTLGRVAAPPEQQVRAALAAQGRARVDQVYGHESGGTATLDAVRYGDVTVAVAPDGSRAEVVAMVEAEGRVAWRDRAAGVTYVGRERFTLRPCRIAGWCGDGTQFEQLRGVLRFLFRRLDALEGGDAAALGRQLADPYLEPGGRAGALARLAADAGRGARWQVAGWQIRVERERAQVGEDVRVEAGGAATERRTRLDLVQRDGRWLVEKGL